MSSYDEPRPVTDVELIALLIGNGIGFGRSGDTALRVFEKFGSLRALLDASHHEIQTVEGVAEARAAVLIATTELVRRALESGAAALIVAHNHPSGVVRPSAEDPSAEDRRLTHLLRDALALVDVRLTDHIVVGESETFSFAQAGLL